MFHATFLHEENGRRERMMEGDYAVNLVRIHPWVVELFMVDGGVCCGELRAWGG